MAATANSVFAIRWRGAAIPRSVGRRQSERASLSPAHGHLGDSLPGCAGPLPAARIHAAGHRPLDATPARGSVVVPAVFVSGALLASDLSRRTGGHVFPRAVAGEF